MHRVTQIEPPAECGFADWFTGADLVDSYAVCLPEEHPDDMRVIAARALDNPPPWIRLLLFIRDGIMGLVGVKSSSDVRQTADAQDRIDFFPILARSANEII